MMDAEHIPAPTRPMRKPVSVVGRRKAAKAGRRMEEEEEVTMSAGIGKRRRHGRGELSERAQVVGVKRGRDEDDEAKDGKEGQNNSEEEEERVEGRELRKRGRLGYRQDGDPEVEYYEPGELDSDTESEESDDEVEVYWTIVSDEPVKQQEAPAPTNAAPRKRTDGEEEDEDYERERGNRKRVKRSRKSMA